MVVVTLRPEALVSQTEVTIGAVATVEGGETVVRQLIAGLDVAEVARVSRAVVVTREEVNYRIQLAGFDVQAFRVDGPAQVMVKLAPREIATEEVVKAAQQAVLQRLAGKTSGVEFRLLEPLRLPVMNIEAEEPIRLAGELAPGANVWGKVRVEVAVWVNDQRRGSVPVALEVTGRKQDGPAADDAILIRVRDSVRLVAIVGSLHVTAVGEALQEGRMGQLIRVRNVDSGKVVVGRVAGGSLVEVEY
jgi:hypothetical protein